MCIKSHKRICNQPLYFRHSKDHLVAPLLLGQAKTTSPVHRFTAGCALHLPDHQRLLRSKTHSCSHDKQSPAVSSQRGDYHHASESTQPNTQLQHWLLQMMVDSIQANLVIGEMTGLSVR